MTHDVVRVGRTLLTGLASKVMQPKQMAAWKDNYESDEWGEVLSFLGVCKDFVLKKRIPLRANEDNTSDFKPCDAWVEKELEKTRQRLQSEGYNLEKYNVRPMLRSWALSIANMTSR